MWGLGDLGTRDEGLEDIKYGTRGCGTSNTGTQGTRDVNKYCKKSKLNAISVTFLV